MEQASSATETRRLPARHGGHSRVPPHLPAAPRRKGRAALDAINELLAEADVVINGDRPWDLRFHHPETAERILARGSLGLGESYMDGWWDCDRLDEFFARVLAARLDEKVATGSLIIAGLRARLFNLQTMRRAWQGGKQHYDIGNDLFEAMLDEHMAYTCGYWAEADNLGDAQTAKLDLICRKLGLRSGMSLLDTGCGWGSLMRYAARRYGARCTGVTVSKEQAEYGARRCEGLPVEFLLRDYREIEGRFDRIASVGMFEHVGQKNYRTYFEVARRVLAEDGLFVLHTIGKNRRGTPTDPWIERYIFPNGALPSLGEIADAAEPFFVIEDVHNFGADYDRTLMAWHANFEAAWPRFAERYGERFYRMWRYYLLACAGTFRARTTQLWQVVLSPTGVPGSYRCPR